MSQRKVGSIVFRDPDGKILNDSNIDILKRTSVKEYNTYLDLLSYFLYRNILNELR